MGKSIVALEGKYAVAIKRIEQLDSRVKRLESILLGRALPEEITMCEAQEALERGDKATYERFLEQENRRLKAIKGGSDGTRSL